MPVEDLSQGPNSVNFAVTEYLERAIAARGLEVVSQNAVISFMARNRIRWLGFLGTYHILQARRELGVDLILLGTVTQRQESPCAAFAMALSLIRTSDARTIWSDVRGLSCNEMRHLFGVFEPQYSEDLLPVVAQDLLANWPEGNGLTTGQTGFFEIAEVELRPRYVSTGKRITCRLWFRSILDGQRPEISLKVQAQSYVPMQRTRENSYQASWAAPEAEGQYPVSLILRWPSGKKQVNFLGTYHVDNSSPSLALGLKGVRLHGAIAFRDWIFIVPRFLEREPISRWEFSVKDEEGKTILREDRQKKLPPRFIWRGQCGDGSRAPHGNYQVILKVWDRARNTAVVSEKVALVRNPPDMLLEARRQGNEMVLDIRNKGEVPMAFWHLEMRTYDGSLIKTGDGQALPAEFEFTIPETPVELVVTARDILGNQLRRKIKDIRLLVKQEEKKGVPEKEWLKEF